MKRKIDETKTLKYAVAFYFYTGGKRDFMLGKKLYQYIDTIYHEVVHGSASITLAIVYNYGANKYEVLNVDSAIGDKEIKII